MARVTPAFCPDCGSSPATGTAVDRRGFIRLVGGGMAAAAGAGLISGRSIWGAETAKKPAEELVNELYQSLSPDQKKVLVLPWDHGADGGRTPTRLGMYNSPIGGLRIGEQYSKPQQELIERILRGISSDDEGYEKLSRHGKFDAGGGMLGCGAHIFGDPSGGQKFSWVFAGHHLTVRCDGNSQPGSAFGGPMYYGHSANGYSDTNVFYYQTQRVGELFSALDDKQQKKAVAPGSPGEREGSIRFRAEGEARPGIAYTDLSADQRELVEKVMRDILLPYRREDADEVMEIVKANGGMEKIHLAYYRDNGATDGQRWHFWRLEGPGFVWNYRVLPHVHTFVHIAKIS